MSALTTNNSDPVLAKKELRSRMRAERAARSEAERALASAQICKRLKDLRLNAATLAVYLATPFEANIDSFVRDCQQSGVLAVAPHLSGGELELVPIADDWANVEVGVDGFRAPVQSNATKAVALHEVDLILVPGLAFDARGARLGQGGGWYDRLLAQLRPEVLVVGVCFDFQVVEWVPCEAHDYNVASIVTDQRTLSPA